MLQSMHAELISEIPSQERFAELARGWLTGVLAEVFPELDEGLRTRPVVRATPAAEVDALTPWGEPGHVLARLRVGQTHPLLGGREVLYSEQAWRRLLDGLSGYPFAAEITVWPLDETGQPAHAGYVNVAVRRELNAPDWVRFQFSAPADLTSWPQSPGLQDEWAAFVKRQAAEVGASSGSMTDDIGSGLTALERTTLNLKDTVPRAREVLRGYSWVTVLAGELAGQLGGPGKLAATGAFYEVSELAHGAVWLRATRTVNEFEGDRVRRVFEALAPVLISGMAEDRWGEAFRIVYGVDAADYR